MATRRLANVLADFRKSLRESRQLASDAYTSALPPAPGKPPLLSQKRQHAMTELAFLTAFLAGLFLSELHLYLMGKLPPRGKPPARYAFPPTHDTAMEWVIPEGRDYAQWTAPRHVSGRAERFFRGGRPFSPVLRANQNVLDEARTIRNAIAHKSVNAQEKVEKIARNKLGALPPNFTVGRFLVTPVPGIVPATTFFDLYLTRIELASALIIPS